MSSEDLSMIALEPFISKFVFAIVQNIRSQNFSYEEKQVINADFVPKISEKSMQSFLKDKKVNSTKESVNELVASISKPIVKVLVKKQMRFSLPPRIQDSRATQVFSSQPVFPLQEILPPQPQKIFSNSEVPVSPQVFSPKVVSPLASAPKVPLSVEPSQGYGKISPLLNDPLISLIECRGAGKPVMIIRVGQKQLTRINLNPLEINEILQKVSDTIHIPLLEGVFRAVVDDFSINAIISEMVGSKFVIRKNTPYSLLERQV
ncbi:hypothetical protein KAI32_02065 [Candidatus Pacearchaeota archaeon]|nr:hypothetical protein [Candidatus Pacearchaeota archaeon]